MNEAQQAAYVFSQSVCALAEIEGMKADNQYRLGCGHQVAYVDADFERVAGKYGIDHNSVLSLFRGL